MTASHEQGGEPRKLFAGRAIKIRIALASGLALTVGAWLAPRAVPTNLAVSQERAAPLLEEQVQLREEIRPFVGVQDIALQVKHHSVAILRPASPASPSRNDYSAPVGGATRVAGFGVFVSDTHVLTHSLALDGQSSVELVLGDALTRRARVVTYEPPSGLVLLQTEPSGRAPVGLAAEAPMPGALAVAVGRSDDRDLAVPVFVTGVGTGWYTIGAVHDAVLPGMPVFNLTGELFAVAAPEGREVRAIPVRQAAERMTARAAAGERQSSFGLGFQALSGQLTDVFGTEGVIITAVLAGGPADAADIRVGDVLLTVGDEQIDSVETATHALSTATIGTPAVLRVRRTTREHDMAVTPALAYEIAALARGSADGVTGPEARAVFPAARLTASDIPPSARVLSVNGRTLTTRAQVQRELRLARQAVPVLLRQDSIQFFVAVAPSR
jgi:S1-C subfamily serine protease